MGPLEFISAIVDNLAWPTVVIIALYMFRTPLRTLIDAIRVAKLKVQRGDTTIEGELSTIRDKILEASNFQIPQEQKRLLEQAPIKAVENAWQDLERTATAATHINLDIAPLKTVNLLRQQNILSDDEGDALLKLREIYRYRLGSVDVSSATNFSSTAYALADKIKKSSE